MKVGVYDRELVLATEAFREEVWEGRGPKRRNEEEGGHMLGRGRRGGSPQERGLCVHGVGFEG